MLSIAFAQTAGQEVVQQQSPLISLMPIALIFVIFYFLLIRPQKKSQKEHANMLSNLKKNDDVITSGGIYGTIVNIQDGVITLRIDDNVKIRVQQSAILRLRKEKTEVSS